MSPHYDRHADPAAEPNPVQGTSGSGPDDAAMEDAAEALRQAEVEAVQVDLSSLDPTQLEHMSIDELRAVAKELDVPDRAQITEQDDLIAAIRERL